MDCCSINIRHPLVVVLAAMLIAFASCDDHDSKEREECAESVVGLATCLPYVGGTAKSPTPDCCSSLKQVLNTNKKCVCVIIQDRNDPDLGLNINLTLALGLPQACNAPANISQCPDSPDAQIFYESGNGHVAEGPNDNVKPAAPSDITTPGSIVEQQNDDDDDDDDYASATGKRFVELKIFAGVLFLWSVDFVI
ncbi:non-specific lipid transfer protein GPI-anchored 14-like isoform X2 [Salvia splendens]|uniref:non-specific lipid transfer protein GPI-anchored 14-like isoform X2 n=1 Tax=Salvia splendens TaxID=180675 RepID=UPI001C25C8F3|nr:non-specific lipid transfer protein GPI-anchored 14-like isoform X2 [Salvia splendens]